MEKEVSQFKGPIDQPGRSPALHWFLLETTNQQEASGSNPDGSTFRFW